MKFLLIIGMLLALPAPAAAQKVAVLRGSYVLVMEEEHSDAKARIVADTVCKTIEDADLACVRVDAECSSTSCAKEYMKAHAVDEAVTVTVEQTGAEYVFQLFPAKGLSDMTEKTGAMPDALEALRRLVQKSVITPVKEAAKTKAAAEGPTAASPASENKDPATDPPDAGKSARRKPIVPAAFWATFGLTVAAVGSAAVIETIGYSKWQNFLEEAPADRSANEKESLSHLRTANRALWSIAAVGLVTTIILAPFTDFNRKRKVDVALYPMYEGGALLIGAEF